MRSSQPAGPGGCPAQERDAIMAEMIDQYKKKLTDRTYHHMG
jgi:hypothetical protein